MFWPISHMYTQAILQSPTYCRGTLFSEQSLSGSIGDDYDDDDDDDDGDDDDDDDDDGDDDEEEEEGGEGGMETEK